MDQNDQQKGWQDAQYTARRAINGSCNSGKDLQIISQTEARRCLEQHNVRVRSFLESEEG